MRRVAIFGVGLIGGSFALALRKTGFDGEIVGVSSPRTLEIAREMGAIDRGVTSVEAVEHADFIYLAQPILGIIRTLEDVGSQLPASTLITDAGSTKRQIVAQSRNTVTNALFAGGHPMAGKERSGIELADADLFKGRPYVLCPASPGDIEDARFQNLKTLVERIGAHPVILDAEQHDRLVAFTSHVPQLISTALASVLAGVEGAEYVAGPAVRDMTRLAHSPFHIWRDILQTNDDFIDLSLTEVIARLKDIKDLLASDDLVSEFDRGATGAEKLRGKLHK